MVAGAKVVGSGVGTAVVEVLVAAALEVSIFATVVVVTVVVAAGAGVAVGEPAVQADRTRPIVKASRQIVVDNLFRCILSNFSRIH